MCSLPVQLLTCVLSPQHVPQISHCSIPTTISKKIRGLQQMFYKGWELESSFAWILISYYKCCLHSQQGQDFPSLTWRPSYSSQPWGWSIRDHLTPGIQSCAMWVHYQLDKSAHSCQYKDNNWWLTRRNKYWRYLPLSFGLKIEGKLIKSVDS